MQDACRLCPSKKEQRMARGGCGVGSGVQPQQRSQEVTREVWTTGVVWGEIGPQTTRSRDVDVVRKATEAEGGGHGGSESPIRLPEEAVWL